MTGEIEQYRAVTLIVALFLTTIIFTKYLRFKHTTRSVEDEV
jgi:hypothetical protein